MIGTKLVELTSLLLLMSVPSMHFLGKSSTTSWLSIFVSRISWVMILIKENFDEIRRHFNTVFAGHIKKRRWRKKKMRKEEKRKRWKRRRGTDRQERKGEKKHN